MSLIYSYPMSFALPDNYAARIPLNDELHAHPYEPLTPPERVVSIAMLADQQHSEAEASHLQALCGHFGEPAPTDPERWHIDLGKLRVKVENHQEYTRYKFVRKLDVAPLEDPYGESPLALLPEGWLAALPGKMLVAMDICVMPYPEGASHRGLLDEFSPHFDKTTLTASQVGRSANLAMTDFRVREDGMTRMLIFSKAKLPSQIGRLTHRLVAMETYRMLALLALPEAKRLLTELPQADARLTELTHAISDGGGADDETLMHQLTTLAAFVEKLVATHYRRFSATHAYFDLVFKRLDELHEQQVETVSSLGGILGRRLEPARTTCDAVSHWLDQLASRVGKTTGLLGTRIDVEHAKQNREMLSAMNRRFQLQLRLQQAAELLSIAIFTYYTVNLLDYVVQELAVLSGAPLESLLVKAIAAPLLALSAYLFIRRLRSKREM
ncbi:MAG: DUF3422 domain-containing protein [Zetaproteobacteria bacterium CG12_big_fil_rev_8_21_14_0_65_55_1124]|nr:MAG: DUF3422 domain-containing protein [Zetaproteobacteria bacterium CG08_land_8_20_14_0_20_55_17]PIW43690.1 MAG: DUF3422 domain-containing protein [Zetaproteobacteria bacterium CG12_big_fil_rev_8_21_14_0_65_55_1124]PIY52781.1 MAG: DUF3422 domain-containing protein [Zetaproteobacteria bacterium CG_4_10_14_0_8_um_filter_55_43]PIZ37965.1 MAG: DUF3422 domain-containing protein [Zetaproteobacteria bacterium CG_4_10_14_0_2_um_filter_55_20]PJB80570.1 MAG: DUF3422 domain-containing protein [Zetapro